MDPKAAPLQCLADARRAREEVADPPHIGKTRTIALICGTSVRLEPMYLIIDGVRTLICLIAPLSMDAMGKERGRG